ncbi:hypothetical protein R6Q59_018050 [Mikania micrantha]
MANLIKPSLLVLLLFAALIELLPSGGLAEDPTPFLGFGPSASQFPSLETIEQCWVSLEEIVGCYTEVYRAFLTGKVGLMTVGPSCCIAINDITSNCWSQMFPDAPSFPSLLRNYCMAQTGQGSAPTPSIEPADL